MIKDISSYCESIAQTKHNFRESEAGLKNVTVKEEYFKIEETIKTNEVKTKCLLHLLEFKKFNNLKYKPEIRREETLQPIKESTALKKLYPNGVYAANTVNYNNHIISRNTSYTNVAC